MRCFEQSAEIQAPLQACFGLWIAHDYYPRCMFSEIPTLRTTWSSSDAWGENQIEGIRKLNWSLIGNLSDNHKSICWRFEETLQGKLIALSGFITLDAISNSSTRVTITMNWNSILEDKTSHHLTQVKPEQLLMERLQAFNTLVSSTIPYTRPLKAVV